MQMRSLSNAYAGAGLFSVLQLHAQKQESSQSHEPDEVAWARPSSSRPQSLINIKKRTEHPPFLENTPTCCRAPRWPDLEFFGRNTEKLSPGKDFLEYQEKTKNCHLWYLRGVLLDFCSVNSGSPELQAAGIFFGIFCGNSGLDHLGSL